ncbi:MAG: hypothetical protein LBR58_01445 [Propionibacteriaceae bacterium]|jgi:hypothetical protein|nr:hypothetical protein [Propionibacteriaceae bacterium]
MSVPRRWALLAAALALAYIPGSTAAYSDRAHFNVDTATLSSFDPFELVVVDAGVAHRADPVRLSVADGDLLLPGHTVTKTLTVANNNPVIAAAVEFRVLAVDISGSQPISDYLRFSVADSSGATILGDPGNPANGASKGAVGRIGVLDHRGDPRLADGDPWTPGPYDSWEELTVTVHLLNHGSLNNRGNGWARVAIQFDATSVDI